jgi:SAM-dependent methyltransferase
MWGSVEESARMPGPSRLLLGPPMNLRDRIRAGIDFSKVETLEIGPLYRPFVLKSEGKVIYVDHADTRSLREKYKDDPKFDVADIVDVDAVWGAQTLSDCIGEGRKVDLIIASHVIEHVPDLIAWLNELRSVLKPEGEIRLVVPDKRYTFDYTRRTTVLPDILDSYLRKARSPLPRCILDHVLNVRAVDTGAAWAGPLDHASLVNIHPFELAVDAAQDALTTGSYHDVHCWVFTPLSFAQLMRQCAEQGLIDLACHRFEDTLYHTLEFTAFLKPAPSRDAAVSSWAAVERALLEKQASKADAAAPIETVRAAAAHAAETDGETHAPQAAHAAHPAQAAQAAHAAPPRRRSRLFTAVARVTDRLPGAVRLPLYAVLRRLLNSAR